MKKARWLLCLLFVSGPVHSKEFDRLEVRGIMDSLSKKLIHYGWGRSIREGRGHIVFTQGTAFITNAVSGDFICSTSSVLLKDRLIHAGYEPRLGVGVSEEGVEEIFIVLDRHYLTMVPGRAGIDDPTLNLAALISSENESSIRLHMQEHIGQIGSDKSLFPLDIVKAEGMDWLLCMSIWEEAEIVRIVMYAKILEAPRLDELDVIHVNIPVVWLDDLKSKARRHSNDEFYRDLRNKYAINDFYWPPEIAQMAMATLRPMILKINL